MQDDVTLVVGATGLLGFEISRLLLGAGGRVRTLVRASADNAKRKALMSAGAELVTGDLKDPASVDEACKGVRSVVTTASATVSRQPGDSIQAVDHDGQAHLVSASSRAGVKNFVFVSFPPLPLDFALQRAKRAVEERLRDSSMSFTVLQPMPFTEVWLGAAVGFDPARGSARVFGTGERAVSWVSFRDAARFAAAAVQRAGSGSFEGKTVALGGPDALSPRQAVAIFEELGSPKVTVESVPEPAIRAQFDGARDDIQQAFAAMMLAIAHGHSLEPGPALEILPGRLITVREYAKQMLGTKG
jgi:NADH dehydrogenase